MTESAFILLDVAKDINLLSLQLRVALGADSLDSLDDAIENITASILLQMNLQPRCIDEDTKSLIDSFYCGHLNKQVLINKLMKLSLGESIG